MPEAARDCLLFGLFLASFALPVAGRYQPALPLLRLAAALGGGLLLFFFVGFAIYLLGAPWTCLWIFPPLAALDAWFRRARLRDLLGAPDVGAALTGWLLVAAWCLGWQALVATYAGGGWAGDWAEHYDRARFFAFHLPADFRFLGFNPLAARPPLANLVIGALLALTDGAIAHFQVFATLLGSLVCFPVFALAQRHGASRRELGVLTVLLMLNPMFLQNATFPWTKLAAAFFIVLALVCLPHPGEKPAGIGAVLGWLAAGMLAHYSAAPWIIALAVAWLVMARGAWNAAVRREVFLGLAAALLLAAPWALWGSWRYGFATMVHAPATLTLVPNLGPGARLAIAAGNTYHMFLPNWDSSILALFATEPDWQCRLHDIAFTLYQQNLLVAFGLGNLGLALWLATRNLSSAAARSWLIAGPLAVVGGAVVSTGPIDMGSAHICLQPLVFAGLTWIAVRGAAAPAWLRRLWLAGLAVDFVLGIALHFSLQSLALIRALHPDETVVQLGARLGMLSAMNLHGKLVQQYRFLGDALGDRQALLLGALAVPFALALLRCRPAAGKMVLPVPATPA